MNKILMVGLLGYSLNTYSGTVDEMLKLRQEVEVINQELQTMQKSYQSQMDVYIQEDQDLEAKTLQEKLKTTQISKTISLLQLKTLDQNTKKVQNKLPFEKLVADYLNYLNGLLPDEKIQSTEKIEKIVFELKTNKLTYEQALLQVWFLFESDLRSSQEVSFKLSKIDLDGESFAVEMVKLGRSLAYIRTTDKRFAFLNNQNTPAMIDSSNDQKNLEVLFSQIKKDQKTGVFELPMLSKIISN